ncbi:MAG: two-component system, OmpR family, sensor kinase [Frankiaceae bacterium]|jgi:signal transduction histidine kinase|nr:two-component system, OmpR family, sensor kinase [Frankiaceae bacterium]
MRGHLIRTSAIIVAVALAVLTFGFWWVLHERLHTAVGEVLRQRSRAASALVVLVHGKLAVEETAGDEAIETGFWLYDSAGHAVAHPATRPEVRAVAAALGRLGQGDRVVAGTRLLATPAVLRGRPVGVIVVGEPLRAFQDTERLALVAALVLDAVVLAGAVLLTRRNVSNALLPVARMTAAAQDWSEHDLDRRFDLGPPSDELSSLAATLDSLLGRLSSVLRHEQRLTAEIAHEIKTPLARMRSTAEIAARHGTEADRLEALAEVEAETVGLAAIVDTLLAAHSEAAGHAGECDPGMLASHELLVLADQHPQLHFDVIAVDAGVLAGCDEDICRRALAPILTNACRHARSRVTVTVTRDGASVFIQVDDDGPGFAEDEVVRVFQPGFRGRSVAGSGSGLGLPLARRLARAVGGDVHVSPGPGGQVRLRLPST